MKEGTPRWSAVVVAFNGANILAVSRGYIPRDPAMPGGDATDEDTSPAATAAREMFEETGLRARELRLMDVWEGTRGQKVYVFFVPRWQGRLRSSSEGKAYWSTTANVLRRSATFRFEARRILEKLQRLPGQIIPAEEAS